jgi:hypothetical protein
VAYTSLAAGNHTFSVRASDDAGNTDSSPATHAWTVQGQSLAPATALTAKSGFFITVDWDASTGPATGYRVYRSDTAGGPYVQIEETPANVTLYTDTPADGTYYYVVRAVNGSTQSVDSNEASAVRTRKWYLRSMLTTHPGPGDPAPTSGVATANLRLNQIASQDLLFDVALPNYDTNQDSQPGRLIKKGGNGANESDLSKYQNWVSAPMTSALTINGQVKVTFFSAMKDFGQNKRGSVNVFLRSVNGSTATVLCQGTLTQNAWQSGIAGWVEKELTFNCANKVVPVGQKLEVKIVVASGSGDDMWFAYDTFGQSTRIELP